MAAKTQMILLAVGYNELAIKNFRNILTANFIEKNFENF